MIVLLDNGADLDQCARELDCVAGQLLTPLTRYTLRNPNGPWAIDNGWFAQAEVKALLALLERERHRSEHCIFVTVPDVVGSARRTLEVFERWKKREELRGYKLALACQDGQEHLPIPWDDIDAVFIGGSTNWKCGHHSTHIIKAAQALGKWVHVGRVNGPQRFKHFEKLGVDSVDGTGIAKYTHMRRKIASRHNQKGMFDEEPLQD